MDRIRLVGGNELRGEIAISGAKNAALPLMIASLLSDEPLVLTNVPRLADVKQLERILENHGVDIAVHGRRRGEDEGVGQRMTFHAADIVDTTAPYDLVSKMRASFWVIGPLLARCHEARVSLPGGCAIGTRPVDLFLHGLKALGAEIDIDDGYVVAKAPKGGLVGATVNFPKVSVGATHTILMAATLARGTTVIENAAQEPEITNVAECLVAMGAKISGIGTRTLTIEGVEKLHGATVAVIPDRIETGTFAMAAAMTGGDVLLKGAEPAHLQAALDILAGTGVELSVEPGGLRVRRNGNGIMAVDVETDPFPGFPTDLQAQFMALMTMSSGVSQIRETIFENRYMHVAELARFGADISVNGQVATVTGRPQLKGAQVMATDLRASVSLVIAGLAAKGETVVNRIYHLDRGFERLEDKLSNCGAVIERVAG
ncbi:MULTISPECIES: UDP-N-acetylglucosamine 1-carboxyvinyltransferase [Devosia]|uniref:UDP-N-acetylglucosamine 1-carboxyvinyltransferase n=1 Tax=Devosia equisanguinis TaxID=2490941 RepID=A0A3S4GI22_9HYPH|nr:MULTISPECIES: UDP-N-acetylglucosamine 1-carboxyvinyltransferase [Devosia]ODT47772.1 MAG: UDP-N-acetylglucosamine 1-carboxyvinyltransferase [Pelagibacterium sp. SCN 63-126]ODU87199.1 MAG: UDP-N-acetylglucosamine 1-carboxyvinyltransferase [Pelagibacterium sp. SCN 63-17]OJX42519.1 MAG: UDP-N-acetylglucosamine 1-carboxyvinyltransferase [Devosia sp. 63-57]VDS03601.1 UDP-N-acetylglucosamine 1-carboxyvinyltransferase [Devosia equisanguinis]